MEARLRFGVTQILLIGTMPNTSVQRIADAID